MKKPFPARIGKVVSLVCAALLLLPLAANAKVQQGTVQSGRSAISNATVKLYQAGTAYGDEARLLGSARSDRQGRFKIKYRAPKGREAVLYLVARGGVVGKGESGEKGKQKKKHKNEHGHNSPSNSAITLAAVLGTKHIPNKVTVNERTTVATAYTMAQFLRRHTISGPAPGVPNAAEIFRGVVNLRNGAIGNVLGSSPNGGETDTLNTFNSLANMLAACVNEQTSCTDLFALATPPAADGADAQIPTDTLQAMLNIAHYPAQVAAALFDYAASNHTYQPALNSGIEPPVAWTVAIRYDGNGKEMDGPGFIAFDEQGTAWIANNYNWTPGAADPDGVVCGALDVLRLTPTGKDVKGPPRAPYTGGGANGAGFGIMIDKYGSVWQGNFGFAGSNCAQPEQVLALAHSVSKYDSDGNALSPDTIEGPPLQPGGYLGDGTIYGPQGMSGDPFNGNVWIANCRNSREARHAVTLLKDGHPDNVRSFTPFDLTGFEQTPGFLPKPFGVTVDPQGVAWVAGNNINQVVGIDENGDKVALFGQNTSSDVMDPGGRDIFRPMGIASDSQGGIWVANSGAVDIACEYQLADIINNESSTYTSLKDAGVLDADGNDGDGFEGKEASIALIKRNDSGEYQLSKFTGGGVILPWGIALDGNDNVWVANFDGQRLSYLCGSNTDTCPPGKQEVGAAISPDSGFPFAGLVRNTGVSIDPSGNVWLTNNWLMDPIQTNPGGREVVVFLGMAKPVVTPLLGYPRAP